FVSLYTNDFFFFFQAEDGIRDFHVTGIQTCALPILSTAAVRASNQTGRSPGRLRPCGIQRCRRRHGALATSSHGPPHRPVRPLAPSRAEPGTPVAKA